MILATFPIINSISLVEAAPGTAVPSQTVLTMTSGNENAGIDLVVRDNNGTFASSSDSSTAKFGIVTDNNTGYTLSIVGANDNGQLTNSTSGTVLDSISSSIDANTFNSSNSYNGKWGYSPSKYNSTANTDFLPSPTTTASILDVTSVANAATANNYTISLGARADYSLPSGIYTNTFTLAVVGNPVAYTISYDKGNTTDTVTNLPTSQSSSTTETSVALSDTVPVRSGYDFIGWCNGTVTTDEDETDTCSNNTIYNPNGDGTNLTFGIDQTTANVVTLHAMWQKVKSMQVWTGCSAMSSGDKIALTDARDGQEYDVTKIGDYCIMTENLAISGTIPAEGSNFTGADITPDYTDYGWFTSEYAGSKVIYKSDDFGGYYNYCLASAGTVCSDPVEVATQDICPTNWKIAGWTTIDTIRKITGSGGLFAAQIGKFYRNGSLTGSYGHYWLSTTTTSGASLYPSSFYASTSSLGSGVNWNNRYDGLNIRCVYSPDVTVTINSGVGIDSVSVGGGASSAVATYTGRVDDVISISATPSSGYGPAYTWTKNSGAGSFAAASTNTESNTFALGSADTSLSISATSGVAVIIKVNDAAGPSLTLNGTSCSTTAGCLVTGLTPGSSYDLVANITAGMSFSSWSATAGNIANASASSTRYTVPSNTSGTVSTITLNVTRNKYNITIKRVTGLSKVSLNGTECASTSGCTVSGLEYGKSYVLTATKSSGYDFVSWDAGSYGSISNTSSASTSYTVGVGASTITPSVTSCTQTISGTIQNYTPPSGLCSDASGSLTDNRDNNSYVVAKRADGNIWMLDNLRLSSGTLTPDNTNIASNWSLPSSTSVSYFNTYTEPRINTSYKDTIDSDSSKNLGIGSHKYGVYYNYCAATAGTVCVNSNSAKPKYDICPKGWRLATYGSNRGEWYNLRSKYPSLIDFYTALSLPYSGHAFPNGNSYRGVVGAFTTGLSNYEYTISNDGSGYDFAGSNRSGLSVRCILKPATTFTGTMQSISPSPSDLYLYADGSSGTLKDSRDNQEYTVAKINGNLWMTRNLAIGCNGSGSTYGSSVSNKTLTSSSSNVTNSWSTPTLLLTDANGKSSYNNAAIMCDSTYGAWYNYVAASAGTITGDSNQTEATSSICPKGWRLPTNSEQSSITSQASAYGPVAGGYYEAGSLRVASRGLWWSSTVGGETYRYYLNYSGSSLDIRNDGRHFGFYVRCIKS